MACITTLSSALLPKTRWRDPTKMDGTILTNSARLRSFVGSRLSKMSGCRILLKAQQTETEVLNSGQEEAVAAIVGKSQVEGHVGVGEKQTQAQASEILKSEEKVRENEKSKSEKPSTVQAAGAVSSKDEISSAVGMNKVLPVNGSFQDPRWKNGTWDLAQFTKNTQVDWDAVIDAEVFRRKWLEENPEASSNDDPVVFDTSTIPWWAWMKRFHLPQAELLNGRAAMIGFFMAYFVDSLTGIGIVDQTSSFFGKLLLFVAVAGVLLIRRNEDLETLKQLVKESTFYDKQWQATWLNETAEKQQE